MIHRPSSSVLLLSPIFGRPFFARLEPDNDNYTNGKRIKKTRAELKKQKKGREFLTASSCDEYVWALFSAAQTRGVRLTPALLPQKHKIVIYSHTEPEIIVLNGEGSGGDGSDDDGGGDDDDTGRDDAAEGEEVPGDAGGDSGNDGDGSSSGGGAAAAGSDSTFSWSSSSLSSSKGNTEEVVWGDDENGGENGGDNSSNTSSVVPAISTNSSSSSYEEEQQEKAGEDVPANSTDGEERQRGRTLLWGPPLRRSLSEEGQVLPAPGAATLDTADGAGELGEGGDGEGEEEGGVGAGGGDLATFPPAEASVAGASSAGTTLDDWQQVVAYYQSVQLCLQEVRGQAVASGTCLRHLHLSRRLLTVTCFT